MKNSNLIYYMMIAFMLSILISMLIMKISIILSMKFKMNLEKMSPFECGFNPFFFKRLPFSIRFFLITIIFLIFDIEIALLMPMIYSIKLSNMITWTMSSMLFIMMLLMGLLYEWNYGALNWI